MGEVVDTCIPKDETAKSLAEMMVGMTLNSPKKTDFNPGETVLALRDMSLQSSDPFGTSLRGINMDLRKGEVMGIGGVAGNGQDELLLALSGEASVDKDQIHLKGQAIGNTRPNERRVMGLLAAPEERLGHAAAPEMSLAENALLNGYSRMGLTQKGFLNRNATQTFADKIVAEFDVRTPSIKNAAKSLSGGNLQKFVVGREILQNPDVLVINQPTWGVDAAAAADIRAAILELANNGAAVLVVSQDLDELMEISDTFAVLAEGRMSTPRSAQGVTIEEIGLMMGGTDT
jgi:simple sugar transport system ATP-binding protein